MKTYTLMKDSVATVNLDDALGRYWGRLPRSVDKMTRCAELAAVQERLHCVLGNILHARNIHKRRCAKVLVINNVADRDDIYTVY